MKENFMRAVTFFSVLMLIQTFVFAAQDSSARYGAHQHQSFLGYNLDVMTQKGGKGSFNRSDAFGPQEILILFANVTTYEWPEQSKEVAFEIDFPNGTIYNVLYNKTDETGIAWVKEGLPWLEEDPKAFYGNWTVVASAYVAGTTVSDIVEFEYGWLAEALLVEPGWVFCGNFVSRDAFPRQDPFGARVGIKTITMAPMSITLAFFASDESGFPFSSRYIDFTVPGRFLENISIALGSIPESASSGVGAIEVGILDGHPDQGGLALCPNITRSFNIYPHSSEVTVAVPGDYFTIQEAISNSDYCTTISVSPGTYREHLVIERPVSIVAEDPERTIIDGEGGVGITVEAPYVSIQGFTISNCSIGIHFLHTSYNVACHNNFVDNQENVYIQTSCSNCLLSSNNITWDNGFEGNYWSNYKGSDTDGDGIGNTYLPCEGVDNYPLMNLYWNPNDIDHDLDIDIFDVVGCAIVCDSTSSSPNWNPHCDVAEPYGVINTLDIATIASGYGKKHTD